MGTRLPLPNEFDHKGYFQAWLHRAIQEGHKRQAEAFVENCWKAAQRELLDKQESECVTNGT